MEVLMDALVCTRAFPTPAAVDVGRIHARQASADVGAVVATHSAALQSSTAPLHKTPYHIRVIRQCQKYSILVSHHTGRAILGHCARNGAACVDLTCSRRL